MRSSCTVKRRAKEGIVKRTILVPVMRGGRGREVGLVLVMVVLKVDGAMAMGREERGRYRVGWELLAAFSK
jgi:hypothetical protein